MFCATSTVVSGAAGEGAGIALRKYSKLSEPEINFFQAIAVVLAGAVCGGYRKPAQTRTYIAAAGHYLLRAAGVPQLIQSAMQQALLTPNDIRQSAVPVRAARGFSHPPVRFFAHE